MPTHRYGRRGVPQPQVPGKLIFERKYLNAEFERFEDVCAKFRSDARAEGGVDLSSDGDGDSEAAGCLAIAGPVDSYRSVVGVGRSIRQWGEGLSSASGTRCTC